MIIHDIPDAQLHAIAARAKAALPLEVNGRIEKAIRLVRGANVELHPDGSATVLSETDGLTGYRVADGQCSCPDFAFQAPDGWCAHRIAAGMARRCQRGTPPPPTTTSDGDSTLASSSTPDASTGLPAASPAVPSTPLPEAPASVNVHLELAGRQVQLTLRDSDEGRLLQRLEAVLQRFPLVVKPTDNTPQCPKHGVAMKLNHGKDGSAWYSHKTAEGWCKGK